MAKTIPVITDGKILGYEIECPGCGCSHELWVNHSNPTANWQFNGDLERPTFSPSLRVRSQKYPSGGMWPNEDERNLMLSGENMRPLMIPTVCHSFIRDGKIQFLDDCTHELKGQTVELPDL